VTLGLVVCTAATVITLLARPSLPALAGLIIVAAALGGYWCMIVADSRRPRLTLRAVLVAIILVLTASIMAPPRESGDVWSYAMYGRMVAVHHASPYRHLPDEYANDPMLGFVSTGWQHTRSVYGPGFTGLSAVASPLVGDSGTRARFVYQALAALAVAAALALIWRRTRSPGALAWFGLHPVVALQLVNGGHNDALVGLAVLGAVLLAARGKLWRSGVAAGAGAVVKATGLLAGAGLAIWSSRRHGPRRAASFGAATAAVVVASYAAAGGGGALGPLRHATKQISRGSIWKALPRLGLPSASTTVAIAVAAAVVALCLSRQTKRGAPEAGFAAPAAFLLSAPYVLPFYFGWVLPAGAIQRHRTPARIVAIQATVLVAAYQVFRHPVPGPIGGALTRATLLMTPFVGIALLAAYVVHALRRGPDADASPESVQRADLDHPVQVTG
jgi:hypothetical protein